jgi:hypothetical protein
VKRLLPVIATLALVASGCGASTSIDTGSAPAEPARAQECAPHNPRGGGDHPASVWAGAYTYSCAYGATAHGRSQLTGERMPMAAARARARENNATPSDSALALDGCLAGLKSAGVKV